MKKHMVEALNEAKKALEINEVPIGAVVVHKDQIIGRGYNLKESQNDATAHAEIVAIKEAADYMTDWRLTDCHLYVTIEPCPMCAGAIQQARIKRLIYGAKDSKSGAAGSLINILNDERFNHQVEITAGVKAEEARKLMQNFFKKLRK